MKKSQSFLNGVFWKTFFSGKLAGNDLQMQMWQSCAFVEVDSNLMVFALARMALVVRSYFDNNP